MVASSCLLSLEFDHVESIIFQAKIETLILDEKSRLIWISLDIVKHRLHSIIMLKGHTTFSCTLVTIILTTMIVWGFYVV